LSIGGARAIITVLLACVLTSVAAEPAFADASSPRTSSAPRGATPAATERPSAVPTATVDTPVEDTDPDSDWAHAEHSMPGNAGQPPAAAGAAGPVNAASENLPYSGGPVIVKPTAYLIFWGPQWINGSTDANGHVENDTSRYVHSFFNGVGGSPWLNSVTQYYCQGDPLLIVFGPDCSKLGSRVPITNPRNPVLSAIYDPRPLPTTLDDAAVRREARTWWLRQNRDSNAIYFVFTPSGFVTSDLGSNNCAYHGWERKGVANIWFSYIPYQPDFKVKCYANHVNKAALGTTVPYKTGSVDNDGSLDGFSIVGGHELAEAITDPAVRGPTVHVPFVGPVPLVVPAWTTLEGDQSKENGDLCTAGVGPWDTPYGNIWLRGISDGKFHAFAVQGLWSQADHGCPLGYPLRAVVPAVDNGALGHTSLDVQNRGSTISSFSIQYFDSHPDPAVSLAENSVGFGDGNEALGPNATWSVVQAADHHSMPDGGSGTALVYGLEPVQVTVRQSAGAGHDPSGYAAGRPDAVMGTTLTAADIDFDGSSAAQTTTRVSVINAGATRTNFSVQFHRPDGFAQSTPPYLLHAGFGRAVTPTDAGIQGVFKGTATIVSAAGDASNQDIEKLPLAAAVTIDRKPTDALSTYLATPAAGPFGDGTTLYAPLLYGQPPPPTTAGPTLLSRRTVAAGDDFGLALKQDGTVVAWGGNQNGQLGNGADLSAGQPPASGTPVPVDGGRLSGVVSVVAGSEFALALKGDGTVWGWGLDRHGELGNGGFTSVSLPSQVVGPGGTGFLTDVVSLAAGMSHAVAVRADGTVWTWGDNSYGQLGDNGVCSCRQSPTPIQVVAAGGGFFADAVAAAPGFGATHSTVIRRDGTVWAWGDNFAYQSGRTTGSTIALPTEIPGPAGSGFLQGVVEASAGFGFNVVLRADGTAWGWGDSIYHQLGTNLDSFDTVNARFPVLLAGDVVAIAAGLGDTMLVRSDGSVTTEGSNGFTEAGFVTPGGRNVQVLTPVPGVTGATQVAVGDSFEFAVTSAGNVWAWGNNESGALGRGNVPPCSTCGDPQPPGLVVSDTLTGPLTGIDPGTDITVSDKAIARLAAGQQFTLALTSAGTVVGWGADNRGQLGDNNNQASNTPVPVVGLARVVAVAAGLAHSLALTEQGNVYAWGYNGLGNLGLGDTRDRFVPTPVPGLPPIVAIAGGADHSLALDSTGQVWAWGYNGDGELGDGTTVDRLTPEAVPNLFAVQIGGGLNYSISVDMVNRVWTWGNNSSGQLGVGNTTPSLLPEQVPGLPSIAQIAAGIRQAYALDFQGHIYAWGSGQAGELGNGQSGLSADSPSPVRVVAGDGVTPLAGAEVVASGFGAHAFALMADGTVLAWGASVAGELGTGSDGSGTPAPVLTGAGGAPFGPVRALASTYLHTVAVEPDGSGWSWGINVNGELGSGSSAYETAYPGPIPALPGVAGGAGGGGGGTPPPPFSSRLALADPGDASLTVTITYISSSGVETTRQAAIPPHGQVVIDQASAAGPPPSSAPYTAVLTSDHPLAAVAEILPTDPASARGTAYNLFQGGGGSIGVPRVEHAGAGGVSTALLLMGVDAGPVQATVTYLDGIGVAINSVALSVPPNGVAIADQSGDLASGAVASAIVAVAAGGRVAVLEVGTGATGLTSVSLP
jgi:alpha-tubulin suppressor-like RCC1 family protein